MPYTPRFSPSPRRIELLGFPDVQLLDLTGPLQVLASANEWAKAAEKPLPYSLRLVAPHSPVLTSSGLPLVAHTLTRASAPLDTLIVAGGRGVHAAAKDVELLRWLQRRAARARRVVSICTGAFLLGAAGLLKNRRAVTHWSECAELARQNPTTSVEVDPIFVRDGSMWTSAGVTAGVDLSLALVEEDIGHGAAMAVARDLVVFLKRPGGQAQFSCMLELQQDDVGFDRLHGWILENLARDLRIPVLAAKAAMSERTFVRRYREAIGIPPARAVERMRIEAAQQLLVGSSLPIKRIAQRCGFRSDEAMRQGFQRHLGIAPSDFRHRFAAKSRSSHNARV